MLGEGATGEEAVDLGLGVPLHPADELDGAADEVAARLASGPTRSLGLSKRLLNEASRPTLPTPSSSRERTVARATSADLMEGMAAFAWPP